MKIGMILDAPYPPDPRVTNEAKALIDSGNEIYLFCLSFEKTFNDREVVNGINVVRFYCTNILYKLSALAYTFPFYKWIMSKKIKKFINDFKIETIHIHDLQIASSVFKANSSYNLNVTLDLHENRPEIMKFYKHVNSILGKLFISPSKWKKAEEKYCKISNSVVVVTDLAKRELVDRIKINSNKVIVFSNSVSKSFYTNPFINQSVLDKYSDSFVLLYLGNTSERRGIDTVLNAMPALIMDIPNIKLVVVGSSSYDNNLKSFAYKNNIENYIDFEGWKDESLFPSYLKSADLGISPLHSNIHHDTTYANKVFQYMSFGCPLVCSDVNAQKELVENFEVGVLFKSRDSSDFKIKVKNLYKNNELRLKMKRNCLQAIENHLNSDLISKNLVKYYDQ
ncbi:MAG TPA: glycosyltransferase family 1 protein [Flavobacteriaceae bacterium]|jgi:glycosyltransferase involved in cell wall biosynthesis|nr:glycosyltransferase family 1 protein [Flavobacteriaceae bacterium]